MVGYWVAIAFDLRFPLDFFCFLRPSMLDLIVELNVV